MHSLKTSLNMHFFAYAVSRLYYPLSDASESFFFFPWVAPGTVLAPVSDPGRCSAEMLPQSALQEQLGLPFQAWWLLSVTKKCQENSVTLIKCLSDVLSGYEIYY